MLDHCNITSIKWDFAGRTDFSYDENTNPLKTEYDVTEESRRIAVDQKAAGIILSSQGSRCGAPWDLLGNTQMNAGNKFISSDAL